MRGFSSAKYFSSVFPSSLMSAACSDSGGLGHFFGLNTNPPHSRAQATAKAEGSDLKCIQKPHCKQGKLSWQPPRWRISKFPLRPANTPQFVEHPHPEAPLPCSHQMPPSISEPREASPTASPDKCPPPAHDTPLPLFHLAHTAQTQPIRKPAQASQLRPAQALQDPQGLQAPGQDRCCMRSHLLETRPYIPSVLRAQSEERTQKRISRKEQTVTQNKPQNISFSVLQVAPCL